MQIFLTYASEQKAQAEAIAFSLRGRGHKVFLDKDDLPPGKSYDEQIEIAIANSDYLLFLISPDSIRPGRYTLTELDHARRKWRSPDGYILPVMVEPTDMSLVPKFLSAVTILEPKGNIAAEVAAHVKETDRNANRNLVAYFAAAGALSGLLSDELLNLPGMGLLYPLGGGISIYPGIYFGLALCGLFYWRLRTPLVYLALVLVTVQIAWQAAVNSTGFTERELGQQPVPLVLAPSLVNSAQAADRHSTAEVRLRPRLTILGQATEPQSEAEPEPDAAAEEQQPADATAEATQSADETQSGKIPLKALISAFIAGSIGAFGTWLAALFAYRRLLSADAAIFTTVVGGTLGMILTTGSLLLLFVVWQSAVAASIARSIVRHR